MSELACYLQSDLPGFPDTGIEIVLEFVWPLIKVTSLAASLGCRIFLNCFCSFADHLDDFIRLGEHGNVAAFHLNHGRSHTLRDPSLQIGMHGVVLRGQNVPARLRFPRGSGDLLLLEQIDDGSIMSGPNQLLVCFRKVSREKLSTVRKHPGSPVRDLDAREDIQWILVELILDGLADIRGNRSDVDEAGHAIIDTRGRKW